MAFLELSIQLRKIKGLLCLRQDYRFIMASFGNYFVQKLIAAQLLIGYYAAETLLLSNIIILISSSL